MTEGPGISPLNPSRHHQKCDILAYLLWGRSVRKAKTQR